MKMIKSLVMTTLFLTSMQSSAAVYECLIKTINYPENTVRGWRKITNDRYVGKLFYVDTSTGVMRGIFRNDIMKPPTILNYGNSENSFVVATVVSPLTDSGVVGTDTRILRVRVWEEGQAKPFTLLWDDEVYRGECRKIAAR